MPKILVTGATGQIGSELTPALRRRFGGANVLAAGHKREPDASLTADGPFCAVDVRDLPALSELVADYAIDTIYHLGALLSAVAEDQPQLAWDININGLTNVLEVARTHGCAVFFAAQPRDKLQEARKPPRFRQDHHRCAKDDC